MVELISWESLVALLTLTALEIVLGIDNIVFIAILTGRLDPSLQGRARRLGLFLAMFSRILLLLAITWIMKLTQPLFSILHQTFSGKDLILLAGGLFLLGKATFEIHAKIEGEKPSAEGKKVASFGSVIVQIILLDIVFSLDSVITAVGMARHVAIMITAIVIAVAVMLVFAGSISRFIERHPTLKMLALSFLLLIGVMLVAESLQQHIDKRYIYFAMAFSLFVEILNLRTRKKHKPPALEKSAA
jgi:predicted tellurium resistance membrane protein TerC